MNSILANSAIQAVKPLSTQSGAGANSGEASFAEHLKAAVSRVENGTAEANSLMDRFMAGEVDDLHSVALASQRAALHLEMFLQIRNKVVGAYQEVMRMQL